MIIPFKCDKFIVQEELRNKKWHTLPLEEEGYIPKILLNYASSFKQSKHGELSEMPLFSQMYLHANTEEAKHGRHYMWYLVFDNILSSCDGFNTIKCLSCY